VKDQRKQGLRRKGRPKQPGLWVEELRKKAYIDIKLQ